MSGSTLTPSSRSLCGFTGDLAKKMILAALHLLEAVDELLQRHPPWAVAGARRCEDAAALRPVRTDATDTSGPPVQGTNPRDERLTTPQTRRNRNDHR